MLPLLETRPRHIMLPSLIKFPIWRDPMSNNYNLTQLLSFSQRQIAMVVNKLQRADIGSLQRAEAGSRYYTIYPVRSSTEFMVTHIFHERIRLWLYYM